MRIITLCALLFVLLNKISAQTPHELDDILGKVFANHPETASYNTQKEIAESKIAQVSNIPDPKITLGLNNLPVGSFKFNQEPMTGKSIALSQSIPFPGKLSLKQKLAEWDTDMVNPALQEYKLRLEKEVRLLYWKALLNKKKLRLTGELITLVSGVEEIIATRYGLDQADKQDLVSLQLELTILQDKKEMYAGNYLAFLNELKALAGTDSLNVGESFPEIENVYEIPREKLAEIIENENPSIAKNRLAIRKTETRRELAEKEYYPDFNFTVQYSQRDALAATGREQDDFLSFLVGFNIPLNYGGKRTSAVEETELARKLLDEQINGIKLNSTAAAVKELADLNSTEKRIRILEEGLLPQSELNFNTAISGLGTGVNDYLSVINALEKIIDVKFRYLDLKANYYTAKTNLEYLLGTELNGVENE